MNLKNLVNVKLERVVSQYTGCVSISTGLPRGDDSCSPVAEGELSVLVFVCL